MRGFTKGMAGALSVTVKTWSNVPVDTLIRVKENKIDEWVLRYFAKYKDGKIYAWDYGCTSKTTDCVAIWRYGEIVTEDIK